jgi:hypothetical protein
MVKMITPQETKKDPLIHKRINKTPVNNESIEALTRATDKKVVGTFVNIESPGQPAKICGKYYKDMEYFAKVFEDQERCTIPISVARFINERCYYEQHSYLQDEKGNPIKSGKTQPRYKFMVEMSA